MSIPYFAKDNGGKYFVVHDKPFLPLGGELHNSSGADLRYMEEVVWPALRRIGGNFYLSPAYWEYVEPQEGVYNFDLVDGLIDQARREGVKLGLLWFGTWKNGASDYIPLWLKADHSRYFLARDEKGVPLNTVSPFCTQVRDLDAKAFAALMRHLKEYDGTENTVITVQVENEVGIWYHDRDFCDQSNAAFAQEIPQEVAQLFGVSGTWEEAFGPMACYQFEAYQYARYIETVAAAGKAEYPLPLYVNCVASMSGFTPSGGPDYTVHKMWMHFAPSIEVFSPDIYEPTFREICAAFAHDDNPLFIPETSTGRDTAARMIYAMGAHNCIGFNPFGCEDFFNDQGQIPDLDWASNDFYDNYIPGAGDRLRRAYELTWALWPELRKAYPEGRVHAFYQQDHDVERLVIQDYQVTVQFGGVVRGSILGADHSGEPAGAGLIIERGPGEFLLFGTNFKVQFAPAKGSRETLFVVDKRELRLDDGVLNEGRALNGDERNVTGIGLTPAVITLKLDSHC